MSPSFHVVLARSLGSLTPVLSWGSVSPNLAIFLGAAVAVRRRLHFRMHLLIDRLGPAGRRVAERLVVLSVIAFGVVLVVGGIAIGPIAHRQVTDALEISQFWFFGALPVGSSGR